jgi:hypothetical protein
MSWIKIDDQLHTNEKALDCSLAARGLWLMCLSWVGDKETDGAIPRSIVRLHAGGQWQELSEELVAAGLWETTDTGWQFRNYLDYNKSHAELEAEREKAKNRMARSRETAPPHKNDCSRELRANNTRTSHAPVPVPDTRTRESSSSLAVDTARGRDTDALPPPPEAPGSEESLQALPSASPLPLGVIVEDILRAADESEDRKHWRAAIAAKIEVVAPAHPAPYALKTLRCWERGDGAPPVPRDGSPPSVSRRFETDHQRNARLVQEEAMEDLLRFREALEALEPGASLPAEMRSGQILRLPAVAA